jgi:hypothetical protein
MPIVTVMSTIPAAAVSALAKPRAGWAAADIASAARSRTKAGSTPGDPSAAEAATATRDSDAASAAQFRAKAGSAPADTSTAEATSATCEAATAAADGNAAPASTADTSATEATPATRYAAATTTAAETSTTAAAADGDAAPGLGGELCKAFSRGWHRKKKRRNCGTA